MCGLMVWCGVKIYMKMFVGDGCFFWLKNDILILFIVKDVCKSKNIGKILVCDLRKVMFFENF